MYKENKIVVIVLCMVWLAGLIVGMWLQNNQYTTVKAAAYQKLCHTVILIDENANYWEFRDIPFQLDGDYCVTYDNSYRLKTLELNSNIIIDL